MRYVSVTGDYALAPGITLLESSGHATGHQSLLVEIENGSLLLAVDAIPDAPAMGSGPFPSFYIEDQAAWQRSRDKLLDLAASSGATVIFGHDPAQAELLAPAPGPVQLTPTLSVRRTSTQCRVALVPAFWNVSSFDSLDNRATRLAQMGAIRVARTQHWPELGK